MLWNRSHSLHRSTSPNNQLHHDITTPALIMFAGFSAPALPTVEACSFQPHCSSSQQDSYNRRLVHPSETLRSFPDYSHDIDTSLEGSNFSSMFSPMVAGAYHRMPYQDPAFGHQNPLTSPQQRQDDHTQRIAQEALEG